MSMVRRTSTDSRRRRILMYQYSREGERANPDRRSVEKLRQARRPAAIYGSSVRRRLRGRWYSLVPVRRRVMAAVAAVILSTTLLLCFAHWLAVTWQPLAYREPLARAFRLDRPDSFGTWIRSLLLVLTSGVALLVYQLRRYRNDDFRGSYRIWPPVIVLLVLASLDAIVALVPWGGEVIDAVLGKRIAMDGADWIRIGLTVGGAALALRLVAEVRHSKLAIAFMLVTIVEFALPVAGRWGILNSNTPLKWWLITSAPLMAAGTLCLACTAYLRMLFREVRGLDQDDRLADRLQQWKANLFAARAANRTEDARPTKSTAEKPKPARASKSAKAAAASQPAANHDAADESSPVPKTAAKRSLKERLKGIAGISRYFNLPQRAAKVKASQDPLDAPVDGEDEAHATSSPSPAAKLVAKQAAPPAAKPAPQAKADGDAAETDEPASSVESLSTKPARRGLGRLLARWRGSAPSGAESAADDASAHENEQTATKPKVEPSAARAASTPMVDPDEDRGSDRDSDDEIDWASMNKAERRRLKRELRRSGDAA